MLFEEKIKTWLNESHPEARMTDNRTDSFLWQSELVQVESGKDDDGTLVTILNFKNGYALRLIHKESPSDLRTAMEAVSKSMEGHA